MHFNNTQFKNKIDRAKWIIDNKRNKPYKKVAVNKREVSNIFATTGSKLLSMSSEKKYYISY